MRGWVIGVGVGVGILASTAAWWYVRTPEPSVESRGRIVYDELGCAACHGPGGTGGIINPRSREREVPALVGGTAMMYIESEGEIREWILDGRPARLSEPLAGANALLQMPAYRDRINADDLEALIAYYRAVAWYEPGLPSAAARGRRAASRAGCFGCHGPSGRAGLPNPGSLKGYIPGWGSDDFFELCRDEAELREWILDGTPKRLADNPVARRLLETQTTRMPAYRDVLKPEEIESIVAYIAWIVGERW